MVTTAGRARELSGGEESRILGGGAARGQGRDAQGPPVPAAKAALDEAGLGFDRPRRGHHPQPFAVNDLWFASQTGVPLTG